MTAFICRQKTNEREHGPYQSISSAEGAFTRRNLANVDYYIRDDDWRTREAARRHLIDLTHWGLKPITDHFLHVSLKQDEGSATIRIAYTESDDKGGRNRQTPKAIGVYLREFYPDLSSDDVTRLANEITAKCRQLQVQFATTRQEIRNVYERSANGSGTESCMSGRASRWSLSIDGHYVHPTEIYAAGDLAIAYLEKDERIIARALVWPEQKRVVRYYGGQYQQLKSLLEEQGYVSGSVVGARLLRLRIPGHSSAGYSSYVMPYLDGDHYATRHPDKAFFRMTQSGRSDEDLYGGSTSGYISIREYRCVISDEEMERGDLREALHPESAQRVYVSKVLWNDENIWSSPQGHLYVRLNGQYFVDAWDGTKVPRYYANSYLRFCEATQKYYPSDQVMAGPNGGWINRAKFLRDYVVCQIDRRPYLKSEVVWMEHGAWWSRRNFRSFGYVGPDGKNYANDLREAA